MATFAEGLATREPFEMPLALFPRLVDEIMLVDDDQIAAAIRLVLETARQVAEGAGAAAVAAAMARREELAGKTRRIDPERRQSSPSSNLRRILNHERLSAHPQHWSSCRSLRTPVRAAVEMAQEVDP